MSIWGAPMAKNRSKSGSERLINTRNDLDHNGWTLPRIRYEIAMAQLATRPNVSTEDRTAA